MAIPFIATLAPRIRALLPIITGGVARGLSRRALNKVIKDATGTGVAPQTLLDVMRRIRGVEQSASQLKFLGKTSIPNLNRLPVALTKLRNAVTFSVLVKGLQLDTGLIVEEFVTVALPRPIPRFKIEQLAESFFDTQEGRYKIELQTVTLQGGRREGPRGRL